VHKSRTMGAVQDCGIQFGSVLVVGSVILLSSFLDRRDRRKSERQRAAEKEGKDWGDGFQ
jgi:hypothetical protein